MFLYQHRDWPNFKWDQIKVLRQLVQVRHAQGVLLGKMKSLGFELQDQAVLETLTLDITKSCEIEGELLNTSEVRSSVARKLGVSLDTDFQVGRYTEGVVEMLMDATQNHLVPLDQERLFGWHAALFPTGRSGMHKITVGKWRMGEEPVRVVSGAIGREVIHFEAPMSEKVATEMAKFLLWANAEHQEDRIIQSAIAHLWFVTIHPFDDGNGRITRAISDLFLARSDQSTQRFYSMSAAILLRKKEYYQMLEKTQRGDMDITSWLMWYLGCLKEAILASEELLSNVLLKAKFWNRHVNTPFNDRQRLMINKLLNGFDGKLRTGKWAVITKTSEKTAQRDIEDLVEKAVLSKGDAGGRSTSYELVGV